MGRIIVLFIGFAMALSSSTYEFIENEEEKLLAEIELIDMELQDKWDAISVSKKALLFNASKFDIKVDAELDFASLLEQQSKNLINYKNIPFNVERNYSVFTKPGDAILPKAKQLKLLNYSNNIEMRKIFNKFSCNGNNFYNYYDYQNILQTKRNEEILKECWCQYQINNIILNGENGTVDEYLTVLELVKEAALLNGKDSVKDYWELLLDMELSYEKANNLWEEIGPFYHQLFDFVKARLYQYYNKTINDNETEIPAYLLGSNFGDDWSNIAEIVLPHPQIHYDANYNLNIKPVEEFYKLAEQTTDEMGLGKLGDNFWVNSMFNMTFCDNTILSYCNQRYSEVVTCNQTTWTKYLDAFETAVEVTLNNKDYTTLPRQKLRYSAIDEALINLASILAIENLPHNGVLDKGVYLNFDDNDYNSNKMTKLLLIALRTLPKLPYFLAADYWRLTLLDQNNHENISKNWWQFRKNYQKVSGFTSEEFDFLGDIQLARNKPYLHKFFGIILSFQILQHYQDSMTNPDENVALEIGKDENFRQLIWSKSSNNWPYIINYYYGINDIDASSLLAFFEPLQEYFKTAPLEQQDIVKTTPKPKTTTTTTKTTTTTTTAETSTSVGSNRKSVIKTKSLDKLNGNKDLLKELPNSKEINVDKHPEGVTLEKVTTYIGFVFLGIVAFFLLVTFVYTRLKRRRRTNNRRFET